MTALIISSIVGVVGPAGCGGSGGAAGRRGDGGALTVFAASSLTDAFGELEKRFEEQYPANIESMRDLSKPGIKLVLAEDGVPAADYALKIVDEANAEYGSGFRQDVLSNVVSREAVVRASVGRVALGDADATFGYASDYTPDIRDRVRVIRLPKNLLNRSALYPIAVLEDAREPKLARRWVDLVMSSEGQRVLEKWGFRSAA